MWALIDGERLSLKLGILEPLEPASNRSLILLHGVTPKFVASPLVDGASPCRFTGWLAVTLIVPDNLRASSIHATGETMKGDGMPDHDRRELLRVLSLLPAGVLLSGCVPFFCRRPLTDWPGAPEFSLLSGPLTIDAHCHVFNGTDLQVKDFISKVATHQGGLLELGANVLGSVLSELVWSFAPSGDEELSDLRELAAAIQKGSGKVHSKHIATLRQHAYSRGREQLQTASARSAEFSALRERQRLGALGALDSNTRSQLEVIGLIDDLPKDVETYRARREARERSTLAIQGLSVHGMLDFVLQNFQYRYVSVYDYLKTYDQPGKRVVDLMLPSMVDYDFWLGGEHDTITPLRTQVEVMAQIAILSRGRVHGFAPFNPLRQVAFDLRRASSDSFSLVREAVETKGFVGVKLYPPMGFAALGNQAVQEKYGQAYWARDGVPRWTNREDMGRRLDGAMRQVLSWCVQNDVPVMAHTGLSNGLNKDFESLAGAEYWKNALTEFPSLRVSFGHFGDSSLGADGPDRAHGFTALMGGAPGALGAHAYADAAYFLEVTKNNSPLLDRLRRLYVEPPKEGNAPLANRFMYGTDWEMILTEGSVGRYLAEFAKLFDELEGGAAMRAQGVSGVSAKFFGLNAADWLGLRKGDATRKRLDSFYAAHGVSDPDWAVKLGKLP